MMSVCRILIKITYLLTYLLRDEQLVIKRYTNTNKASFTFTFIPVYWEYGLINMLKFTTWATEACVNADAITAFQAQLRHAP